MTVTLIKKIAVSIVFLLFMQQSAHAIWMRSESIEWNTQISDTIIISKVSSVKSISPLNEYWDSQEVSCDSTTNLKGKHLEKMIFRQDYRHQKGEKGENFYKALKPGARIMLFIMNSKSDKSDKVIFWVNLDEPGPLYNDHAAYNNNCELLSSGEKIIALVNDRIKLEQKNGSAKKRGVIVPFKGSETMEMSRDFVRTADPEFKKTIIEHLKEPHCDTTNAIHNLISYPDEETIKLLEQFLTDPTTSEVGLYGPDRKTITYYPVRQAAYLALSLMGKSPKKPSPYYELTQPWLFEVGMDNPSYFPYGDWKKIEEPRHGK